MRSPYQSYGQFIEKADIVADELGLSQANARDVLACLVYVAGHTKQDTGLHGIPRDQSMRASLLEHFLQLCTDIDSRRALAVINRLELGMQ